jgi:hypothetical protein
MPKLVKQSCNWVQTRLRSVGIKPENGNESKSTLVGFFIHCHHHAPLSIINELDYDYE